jgi:hypothetical protein
MEESDSIELLTISDYYSFQDCVRSQPQHSPLQHNSIADGLMGRLAQLVIGSYCKIIHMSHALPDGFHLKRSESLAHVVVFNAQNCAPIGIVGLTHESDYVLFGHPDIYPCIFCKFFSGSPETSWLLKDS